jgi:hypothetical protein
MKPLHITPKRIASYLSGAGALLLSVHAKGQVLYTDIQPDVIVGPPSWGGQLNYFIDINQDGTNDFKFSYNNSSFTCGAGGAYGPFYYGGSAFLKINPVQLTDEIFYGTAVGGVLTGSYCYSQPYAFNPGASPNINQTSVWTTYELMFWQDVDCSGYPLCESRWPSGNKFVAVKMHIGNANYMGWIRAELVGNVVILKDFAISNIPNVSLPTGAMSLNVGLQQLDAIAEVEFHQLQMSLSFSEIPRNATLHLYNLTGEEIFSSSCNSKEISYLFSVPGVYLIQVETETGRYSKKLFVHP